MRHCGNCGASFEPGTLVNNQCPACGAAISATGDVLPVADPAALDTLWLGGTLPPQLPHLPRLPTAVHSDTDGGERSAGLAIGVGGRVLLRVGADHTIALDQRTLRTVSLILALLALVVVPSLVGAAVLEGSKSDQPQRQPPASATGGSSGSLPAPQTTELSILPSPASTITPGATVVVSATAEGQPVLSVSPLKIQAAPCVDSSGTFEVRNTGGGLLMWTATASNSLYKIDPSNGSLAHDEYKPVTVSHITLSGQITVSAPGAANSPQPVPVACQ